MPQQPNIDGVPIQWGDRLPCPGHRIVRVGPQPKLAANLGRRHAAAIRARIEATVVRRAQQVMVKVTGGGHGMQAIAAYFRYISQNGRLDIEDEHGETMRGKDALHELAEDWRLGGTRIYDTAEPGQRREAFDIMRSMPRGTDPLSVQEAAREFAQIELADHKYVMVLQDRQAHPHVHIGVRAECRHGKRLNPRKADLHRWRETIAEKLRGWGVEAEATRQASRRNSRNYEPLWRVKAGRTVACSRRAPDSRQAQRQVASRAEAVEAWSHIAKALASSADPSDRGRAQAVARFVREM